jgi:hypothetical protein
VTGARSFRGVVHVGAARERGARHFRLVLGLQFFGWAARRLARVAVAAALLAGLGYVLWRWGAPAAAWTGTRVWPAALTAAVLAAAAFAGVLAWRRWGWLWSVRYGRPLVYSSAGAALLVLAGAAALILRSV